MPWQAASASALEGERRRKNEEEREGEDENASPPLASVEGLPPRRRECVFHVTYLTCVPVSLFVSVCQLCYCKASALKAEKGRLK